MLRTLGVGGRGSVWAAPSAKRFLVKSSTSRHLPQSSFLTVQNSMLTQLKLYKNHSLVVQQTQSQVFIFHNLCVRPFGGMACCGWPLRKKMPARGCKLIAKFAQSN
jgi:hypothetical protein